MASVNGFRFDGKTYRYNYDSLDNRPVPDKTLTIEGEFPDSKSVGVAINEVQHMVGSPLVANSASSMTDRTKVYVYTGNETGYTNGHWYYFNGTSWADGGVYNASAVDFDTITSIVGTSLILG